MFPVISRFAAWFEGELELNEQKKRLNAPENAAKTVTKSTNDPDVVKSFRNGPSRSVLLLSLKALTEPTFQKSFSLCILCARKLKQLLAVTKV